MTRTLALRLYGKNDLRLETFDLPDLAPNEILADVRTNSICMSTHKLLQQGADHKRAPEDIHERPVIVGHEMAGTILEVGDALRDTVEQGIKYSVQPALNIPGREFDAPGYSFHYFGGHATHVVIPAEVFERDCFLPYEGEGYFKASLAEPVSCIVAGFNVQYHFDKGSYDHKMGIIEGGRTAVLGGTGPMGLGAIDYALHGPRQSGLLVVTDVDQTRLDRAKHLFPPEAARARGVQLEYVNTGSGNPVQDLKDFSDGQGFDDVFVFAPVAPLVEQGAAILGFNGCLNFFAGPTDTEFSARLNFYDVHYSDHHLASNSGGNTEDMREALRLMGDGSLNPAVMLTHIGGLDSAAKTIQDLPKIGGGKKLIYTQLSLPLTALEDFEALGEKDPLFRALAEITDRHDGLWSVEAENHLLAHGKTIAS